MARKCACCDAIDINLYYVSSSDDYYCGFCHAEQFYFADYDEGYQMARYQIDTGEIDAREAMYSFEQDPPDRARYWGYMQACIHEVESENV